MTIVFREKCVQCKFEIISEVNHCHLSCSIDSIVDFIPIYNLECTTTVL